MQDILSRPRRNRRSSSIRGAISETHVSPANLILPVFIHDGEKNIPISSMPNVDRLGWRHGLLSSVAEARSYGVNSVVLFPKVTPLGVVSNASQAGCRVPFASVQGVYVSFETLQILNRRLMHADPGRAEDAHG